MDLDSLRSEARDTSSRSPTCGAAADVELTLRFFCYRDLRRRETRGLTDTREAPSLGDSSVMLTRWVSSPGTLKLQLLEVDLEILLLSFFMWILQRKATTQTAEMCGGKFISLDYKLEL